MIQRIQTVYLTIIVILSTITLFMPVASVTVQDSLYSLSYKGFTFTANGVNEIISCTWALTIIGALIPIVALISIFLYKKRALQIRLSFINIILMLGYYAALFFYLCYTTKQWNPEIWSLNIAAIFPLICIVLNYLAIRSIKKDQALVKSLDRLR